MQYNKAFAGLTLAAWMAFAGSTSLSAQDWGHREVSRDVRDLHNDSERVERLQADVARDHWRLNEDIRCRRDRAAAQDAQDLARDQRALNAQLRDIHHDREDVYRDNREHTATWSRRW